MELPAFLRFASDATIVGLWGGGLLLLALPAFVGEKLRLRRSRIDAVGCMPWTAVFLASALGGVALLTMALKGWLAG